MHMPLETVVVDRLDAAIMAAHVHNIASILFFSVNVGTLRQQNLEQILSRRPRGIHQRRAITMVFCIDVCEISNQSPRHTHTIGMDSLANEMQCSALWGPIALCFPFKDPGELRMIPDMPQDLLN